MLSNVQVVFVMPRFVLQYVLLWYCRVHNRNATFKSHEDVIKWKHFPRNWPFVLGNSPVPGEFPTQRPVTRSFDVLFDLRLNKRLSKQSWGWWFETQSCPLWRHCNETESNHDAIVRIESRCTIKQNMSWCFFIRSILYGKNARALQRESSFSSSKSNELT